MREQKDIFILKDDNGLYPLDLLFCNVVKVNDIEYRFINKKVKCSDEDKELVTDIIMKLEKKILSKFIQLICLDDEKVDLRSDDLFEAVFKHYRRRIDNVFLFILYCINRIRIGILKILIL